jgi:hypothetical protein
MTSGEVEGGRGEALLSSTGTSTVRCTRTHFDIVERKF